ncbi:MAG: hypothetical protein HGA67_00395 [Candidatus Yonathbacteria bacterium]|nr:hypothetical protein [Candidatus Yonathbacteria bacterium]
MANNAFTFNPKQVSKRLLGALPDRGRDVLSKRFGLEGDERYTLDAIGKEYGITRERVRQIENAALSALRKAEAYEKTLPVFEELRTAIDGLGAVVSEDELFSSIAKDDATRNHLAFFLVLADPFTKEKEDASFKSRWITDAEVSVRVHRALKKLTSGISEDTLVPENELVGRFLEMLEDVAEEYRTEEVARRWLSISKEIGRNPLGEWGPADSPSVSASSIKDYAFLVIRREGNPMHFSEVAKAIEDTFGRKAHVATCHNELIKDSRFVLVGRGLYALTDWGYVPGVVQDVIRDVIKKHGPLTRDEIVDFVMKERYVKPNTIIVNLQNPKNFKRDAKGRYSVVR